MTSPRADSKFEIEQDAFEQWLVTKLKAGQFPKFSFRMNNEFSEELKRQKQIDMENEQKKEKKVKGKKDPANGGHS